MKNWLLLAVLVAGAGCKGLGGSREVPCPPPCAPCPPAPAPESPPCVPPCQPPARQEAPAPQKAAPQQVARSEYRETQVTQGVGAVAQDILLVPRTVYVPYAPQVPVAPVRVANIAQTTTRQTIAESRDTLSERESQRTEAPASTRSDDTNAQILEALRSLNQRLQRLEQQSEKLHAPQKTPCPTPEVLPCPR